MKSLCYIQSHINLWSIIHLIVVIYVFVCLYTDEQVLPAIDHLCNSYVKGRFNFKCDEWPPYHPKHYTTLALVHYKGRHTDTRVVTISQELVSKGKILPENYSHYQSVENSKIYTEDISEIFSLSMRTFGDSSFVLIEGAPGIGKTVLSKEIAYQWAIKKLLNFRKLVFLMYLRDPFLKNVHLVEDLTQYMARHGKLASSLAEYLCKTKGKGLLLYLMVMMRCLSKIE